jgi:hypothetical protein
MKIFEKVIFGILLLIMILSVFWLVLPTDLYAKAKFGYRHPVWPLETCDTSYPLNCSVVYPD